MNSRVRHWREAATVLLTAGGSSAPARGSRFDYQVLLLRRSPRSAFMPSAHVFPGGVVDAADFSPEWLRLLPGDPPRCGLPALRNDSTRAAAGPGPPLFAAERPELGSAALPADVAFRICAIRETFEESGVLLVVPAGEGQREDDDDASSRARPARLLDPERLPPGPELAEWRRRVQRQPAAFLQLCRQLRCVPNLWALHEWSNWLTPAGLDRRGGGRRYDTAFYLCCLLGHGPPPEASHDSGEVTACQWSSPLEAIELFKSQDIWIAPPQLYELCRLCNFSSLRELHRFGSERAVEGCERWMPVVLVASDGHIQLLPGDELYPDDPDLTGERKPILTSTQKIEDLMKGAHKLHRIVTHDVHNVTICVNIQPKYKHVSPLVVDLRMGNNADCNSRL